MSPGISLSLFSLSGARALLHKKAASSASTPTRTRWCIFDINFAVNILLGNDSKSGAGKSFSHLFSSRPQSTIQCVGGRPRAAFPPRENPPFFFAHSEKKRASQIYCAHKISKGEKGGLPVATKADHVLYGSLTNVSTLSTYTKWMPADAREHKIR
jgi:hypothetical protein